MSNIGHGALGLRSGLRDFRDLIEQSAASRDALVRLAPTAVIPRWTLHSGSVYVAPMIGAFTQFQGQQLDVAGVKSLLDTGLTRVETIADAIATPGSYRFDPNEAASSRRWGDGVMKWHGPRIEHGLVSLWEFEADGSDSVGSNSLTENGSPTYVAGLQGNAAQITRADGDFFAIAHATQSGLDFTTGDFAIAAKFSLDLTGRTFVVMGKGDGGPQYRLQVRATPVVLRYIHHDGSSVNIDGTTVLTTGRWYSVIVVVSTTTGWVRMYLDGQLEAEYFKSTPYGSVTNAVEFAVGAVPSAHGNNFNGQIDQLGVWNENANLYESAGHALSAAEHYHAATPGGAPIGRALTPYAGAIWGEFPRLFIHLADSSNPNLTTVRAAFGLMVGSRSSVQPLLGPDRFAGAGKFETWI